MKKLTIIALCVLVLGVSCRQSDKERFHGYLAYGDTNGLPVFYIQANVNTPVGYVPGAYEMPLHKATRYGQEDVVKFLLTNGADPNSRDSFGDTPLMAAVAGTRDGVTEQCRLRIMRHLLANGAKVDLAGAQGNTALSLAVMLNHPLFVEELLKAGANVNTRDAYGCTPLHQAKDVTLAKLLILSGADIAAVTTNGGTPFMIHSNAGHWEIIGLLTNSFR